MTNFAVGHYAEEQAANFLTKQGFVIKDLNWKTKYCEIDIVAEKDECIYFVEVKYRKNSLQGTGFDYITTKKQRQMAFAAEIWVQANKWNGEYCLSAIELEGKDFQIVNWVTDISS